MLDPWQALLTVLFAIQFAFVGLTSLVVIGRYAHDARFRHIAIVAASYTLLTFVTAVTALAHPQVWRLFTLTVAYALGDYAIATVLRKSRARPHRHG